MFSLVNVVVNYTSQTEYVHTTLLNTHIGILQCKQPHDVEDSCRRNDLSVSSLLCWSKHITVCRPVQMDATSTSMWSIQPHWN